MIDGEIRINTMCVSATKQISTYITKETNMSTTKKQYRTMRGKVVDLDILRKKNELTPAVGNARVNARGDELGPGGKIVRKREDIVREYYDKNPNTAKDESGRFKSTKKAAPQPSVIKEELTAQEQELFSDEDWVEDDDGNFVKATATTSKKK